MDLKQIKKALEADKNIVFAYVYGSVGRREKDASDIDIAIFLKKVPINTLIYEHTISTKLERAAKKPVSARIINTMPLLLKSRVLKEGRLIFSSNRKKLLDFETLLMGDYLDFSRLMNEFDEKRLERYGLR